MSDLITDRKQFEKGWGGGLPETPCGFGSRLSSTKKQRLWIPQIIEKYGIKSIADIGAGDLNWIKKTSLKGASYQAYDLVPRHESVIQFDLVREVPPAVDMLICLWVLNHLPLKHCRKALQNLKASGARYLMMTDRPIWRIDQPPEIEMPYLEKIVLNEKEDAILFINLAAVGNA